MKTAIKPPVTKKGPKGSSDLKVFFFKRISPIPIIAPKKKEKKKAIKKFGNPETKPIKNPNFISPNPIHFP